MLASLHDPSWQARSLRYVPGALRLSCNVECTPCFWYRWHPKMTAWIQEDFECKKNIYEKAMDSVQDRFEPPRSAQHQNVLIE